jgi:hypothetical protein
MLADATVHTTGINWESVAVIAASVFAVLSPILLLLIRTIQKWTRVEDKLEDLVTDVKQLVIDKDRVHLEINTQIREDRTATDRRLRWLEEHLWKDGL